ncbi:RNA polymerase II-associated protein RBA50-like [Teratosphaeria destructans]|uniref:RNA polymerase II-associated protein RBA50-like n=1 Tax=Teratosphaeria destructans TaxID=418781 RepID=A0A9W7SPY4_9PEZI|nr:RNA polymerase II-associated protein RBA50-like [Teratosphaeria destructans]
MIRGERFEVDLGSDDEQDGRQQPTAPSPPAFVGDILERKSTTPQPPTAPTLKSKTGFPEHKKRESRFRQQKTSTLQPSRTASPPPPPNPATASEIPSTASGHVEPQSWETIEKQRIDQENRQKLARMTPAEIEQEREELMTTLSPAFLQRLLKRSNIHTGSHESDHSAPQPDATTSQPNKTPSTKSVSFADPAPVPEPDDQPTTSPTAHDQPTTTPSPTNPSSSSPPTLPTGTIHFPQPPAPPPLDPTSPTFLTDLHTKYFPSLPTDPSKLEWMQQPPPTTLPTTLQPSEIRFDFQGHLLPPKTAAAIPTTHGLHHHGLAPDAAGYTIAELALLARSTYAAQRCLAFQTLGRILYRLGRGEFGDPGEADVSGSGIEGAVEAREESFGALARGLWFEVERAQAIETLVRESEGVGVDGGRHVSARNYATEAVWLWRKGGGRRWKAG